MEPTEYIGNRISSRGLEYSLMGRAQLQSRYYNKVMRGGSRFMLHRLKKDQMMKLLLETEFGKKAMREYNEEVKEWNSYKWYCES